MFHIIHSIRLFTRYNRTFTKYLLKFYGFRNFLKLRNNLLNKEFDETLMKNINSLRLKLDSNDLLIIHFNKSLSNRIYKN